MQGKCLMPVEWHWFAGGWNQARLAARA